MVVGLSRVPPGVQRREWEREVKGMRAKTTTTKAPATAPAPRVRPAPRPLGKRVKDPTGRIDLLASRVLSRLVESSGNPALEVMYEELSPTVEGLLLKYLGPRNRRARDLRRYLKQGLEMQQRQREFQAKVQAKVQAKAQAKAQTKAYTTGAGAGVAA